MGSEGLALIPDMHGASEPRQPHALERGTGQDMVLARRPRTVNTQPFSPREAAPRGRYMYNVPGKRDSHPIGTLY